MNRKEFRTAKKSDQLRISGIIVAFIVFSFEVYYRARKNGWLKKDLKQYIKETWNDYDEEIKQLNSGKNACEFYRFKPVLNKKTVYNITFPKTINS